MQEDKDKSMQEIPKLGVRGNEYIAEGHYK